MEIFFNFVAAEFPKTPSPKLARIPPQTPPAGGKSAEAGQIQNPRKIVCPAESALFQFHLLGFSAKWVLTFSNKHHIIKTEKNFSLFLLCGPNRSRTDDLLHAMQTL